MYTGIIEAVGVLERLTPSGRGASVRIAVPASFAPQSRIKLGDSVAANGVCLTATAIDSHGFTADLSAETMRLTCFSHYQIGQKLNLELPCTPATHLGGHIVQGHVDGIGTIQEVKPLDQAFDVWVQAPEELMRYIAYKGSIAVDGVSLTVNGLRDQAFRLTLIPHTQGAVAFTAWHPGAQVNLEVDVLARYLERLMQPRSVDASARDSSGSNSNFAQLLQSGGFM